MARRMEKSVLASASRPPRGFDPRDVEPPLLKAGKWNINALALDVSGACNLACRYCAEAATQPRRPPMTMETFIAAWNRFFPPGRDLAGVSLRFGSGEPLLAFELLREIADYVDRDVRKRGCGMPAFFLTTNGTLINGEIGEWLIGSGWNVKISFDGPQHIHDAWRVGPENAKTFAKVKGVVEQFARAMPDRFSVTGVLCRGSDPAEVFRAIADTGVRKIELVPAVHHDVSVLPSQDDIGKYRSFIAEYIEAFARDKHTAVLVRLASRVARVLGFDNCRVHCGAGRSFVCVGPEGKIYPCFRFAGVSGFEIGTLPAGLNDNEQQFFNTGIGLPYEQRGNCRDCWAAPLCGGPCFASSAMFGEKDSPVPMINCAFVLADAAGAIKLVRKLRKANPSRLLAFLPQQVSSLYEL